MAKIQGQKEGKTYSDIYKNKLDPTVAHGLKNLRKPSNHRTNSQQKVNFLLEIQTPPKSAIRFQLDLKA